MSEILRLDVNEQQTHSGIIKAGVLCTPGSSFGPHGEGYVRFALVLPPEKIAEALEAIGVSGVLG